MLETADSSSDAATLPRLALGRAMAVILSCFAAAVRLLFVARIAPDTTRRLSLAN